MIYDDLSALIKGYAKLLGVAHSHVTPRSLRRGGVTCKRCQHMDVVQALGRWGHARMAKLYVDEVLVDSSIADLSAEKARKLSIVMARFPELLKKLQV